ncbi:trans-aconitate 2-methyltransferase [Cyanobium sp. Morenito 9A2]|uniref:class I SAM-dependent methyltransferase n=1 Tax=Cyanobium sp. Morenito 9A2 TaxID=2823718 RepID=UPI0020CCBA5B|nr:class I SAM-dependent methyltransferase [Cyanobium sp. Morenito 9A2]MCP9848647.1 class I SAM-dependent methyltransferase [Cyanobium sp. Morenito 9A2]
MERLPEPELMDDPLQAQAYAAADFSASDQALVERIATRFGPVPGGDGLGLGERIVDLGCGPGNISFRLAERFSSAAVLGLDGSAAMLGFATDRLAAEPQRWPRLRFQQALLPLGDPAAWPVPFSAVVSNSLLHHLHEPQVLWQAVGLLAAEGAAVHIHDLRRPSGEAALQALVARHAAGAPAVLRRDYANSLHAAFSRQEVEDQLARAGLRGLSVRDRDDRYLEISGRLKRQGA